MEDINTRIVSVASDPGSARALIPVLRELARRGVWGQALVSGPAIDIFNEELGHFPTQSLPDDTATEAVSKLLLEVQANVLLTGSGVYNRIEHTCRLAARANGMKSVSVLDYWFEYEARFQRVVNGKIEKSIPDIVCALDELSRKGLLGAGFEPHQVIVTGGPNLEETLRWWRHNDSKRYHVFREKYGAKSSDLTLVFFSEPYYTSPQGNPLAGPGGLFHPNGKPIFGYTAPEILALIIDVLLLETTLARRQTTLLVKPHPLEFPEILRSEVERGNGEYLRTELLLDADPKELIAIADGVMSMSSITLLEAALVGKASVSVQVGLQAVQSSDPCIGNVLGHTIPVFDRGTLTKVIDALCKGEIIHWQQVPVSKANIIGAASKVANIVIEVSASPWHNRE